MTSQPRDSFFPTNAAGLAALGAAILVWRLGRALAATGRLDQIRCDLETLAKALVSPETDSARPQPGASARVAVTPTGVDASTAVETAGTAVEAPKSVNESSQPASSEGEPVMPSAKIGPLLEEQLRTQEPLPESMETLTALEAASAAVIAVEAALALHAQTGSIQAAARLLIGTLLESLVNESDPFPSPPARSATIDSFKSAQVAAAELDAQLGTLLASARSALADLQASLADAQPAIEIVDASVSAQKGGNDAPIGGLVTAPSDPVAVTPELLSEGGLELPEESHTEAVPVGAEAHTGELATFGVIEQAAEVVSSAEANAGPLSGGPEDSIAAAATSSRLDIQVSKFSNFADLNGYREELAALPGVRDVKIRRVHKGVLFLSVDYDGIVPLTERLEDIRGHPARRVSMNGDTIQVALTDEDVD